jgi:hypothetical protein
MMTTEFPPLEAGFISFFFLNAANQFCEFNAFALRQIELQRLFSRQ